MGLKDILSINEYVLNNTNSSIFEILPPEIISQIQSLLTILKITGIVIIGYFIFLIIRYIFGIKRYKKISHIYNKINEIDRKLDFLLKKEEVKEKSDKQEQKIREKKKGFFKKLAEKLKRKSK